MSLSTDGDRLVLEEFRLAVGTTHADADRTLAAADPGGVPLLTSIGDDRDVASVRHITGDARADGDAIDRAGFGALVSSWGPLRTYTPRIAASSPVSPGYYRLAVTESGDDRNDSLARAPIDPTAPKDRSDATAIGLLWIGAPRDSKDGLLVVLGDDQSDTAPDVRWPLSLSTKLGVRIYRGHARA